MRKIIRSSQVITAEGIRRASVLFVKDKIESVHDWSETSGADEVLDFGDLCVLPGLVDSHVHINDPGRSDWEGFSTATRAAAAGGYTCLVDMPLNSIPTTTNVNALERKRQAASGNAIVDYAFWGGVVQGNQAAILPLASAGVRGFKAFLVHPGIDEFTMVTEDDLRLALPQVAESGLPLLVHAEVPGPIGAAEARLLGSGAKWEEYACYLASRPAEAEIEAIELLVSLCCEFACRMHIVHLSATGALSTLRWARSRGLPITVETCPHYLYFAAEQIPAKATQFKCAPPVREAANRDLLWKALRDGDIDLIATDHSPCPPALKKRDIGDFREAWGGIASLSLALPVMWTAASSRGFDLSDISRWMSLAPAQLAALDAAKGFIAPGQDADFCIFDPDAEWTVSAEHLHFRHPISPYVGERLRGRVISTFVRGEQVFANGQFLRQPQGRECLVPSAT